MSQHDGSEPDPQTPRRIADNYVRQLAVLDPSLAVRIGSDSEEGGLPDLSPEGLAAVGELARRTLTALETVDGDGGGVSAAGAERRCADLLRERLTTELALREAGEDLRTVGIFNMYTLTSPISSPIMGLRDMFTQMSTDTADQWQVVGRRMERVPLALRQYRSTLAEGIGRGLLAGPTSVAAVIDGLGAMLSGGGGAGWFGDFVAAAPEPERARLDSSAAEAASAMAEMRDWLTRTYAPAAAGHPDTVGRERYQRFARQWCGSDLDLDEAYSWAWDQFRDLWKRMQTAAGAVRPGSAPLDTMAWLDEHGEAYDVPDEILGYLQNLTDQAIAKLQGTYFDLPEPLLRVQAMIAPAGSMAAPYYSPPTLDFSRPGRTWLPTRGRTRFPVWSMIGLWYHESVPGHHMQLGLWTYLAEQLSVYQGTMGFVAGNMEGWALYAEHLMDELGYLTDPAAQLGFLNAQMQRIQRVIIDIGLHVGRDFPADSPFAAGEQMSMHSAREFYGRYCGWPADQLDNEMVRYLSLPGQAICYKLGERVWLAGREAAKKAHGEAFDLKDWHMAALSQGSLGLDALATELAGL
ncbi:DUF885 domain-containing protein [Catenulispora sp. NF23]|uniref:DUF885 domain-containing protein n=1 Tax=Catenulispora pinistramenti TaxID=2705254 RepID=A0ABS5KJS2_9ACTN|nr:DUF885 domain-containing protein [Catenulispora pinistramenti]MBS2533327.1 DUF885 domain-containing protein [Catenulispora pinistramenti]MBS2546397.1 DUF885 domain-containing protein [Catenulispora pinistramenti]